MAEIFIDVELNKETIDSAVKEVTKVVRPDWDYENLTVEVLRRGYLNLTLKCRQKTTTEDSSTDTIVLKTSNPVFCGPLTEVVERVRFIGDHDLGPEFLAHFRNGICLEFVVGDSMDFDTERKWEPLIWTKIAEEMARWHRREIFEAAIYAGIRRVPLMNIPIEHYWDDIIGREPVWNCRNELPSCRELGDAARSLEIELLATGDLEQRFCHTDIWSTNTVFDDDGDVRFVDFDFAGIHYIQFDLAWYFRAFGDRRVPSDDIPGYEFETNFIRHYLKHRRALDGEPEPDEEDVRKLYLQVQKCKAFMWLRYVVLVVTMEDQNGSTTQYMPKACDIWKNFASYKKKLMEKTV